MGQLAYALKEELSFKGFLRLIDIKESAIQPLWTHESYSFFYFHRSEVSMMTEKQVNLMTADDRCHFGSWLSSRRMHWAHQRRGMDCRVERVLVGSYMDVSKNRGTSKSSILRGFSIINHPFWGTPIFGNTHILYVICIMVSVFTFISGLITVCIGVV